MNPRLDRALERAAKRAAEEKKPLVPTTPKEMEEFEKLLHHHLPPAPQPKR